MFKMFIPKREMKMPKLSRNHIRKIIRRRKKRNQKLKSILMVLRLLVLNQLKKPHIRKITKIDQEDLMEKRNMKKRIRIKENIGKTLNKKKIKQKKNQRN